MPDTRPEEPDYSHTDAYAQGFEAGLKKGRSPAPLPDMRYRHVEALAEAGHNAVVTFLEAASGMKGCWMTWRTAINEEKRWSRDFVAAILLDGNDAETFYEKRREALLGACDARADNLPAWPDAGPMRQQRCVVFQRTVEALVWSLHAIEKTPPSSEGASHQTPPQKAKSYTL